LRRDRVRFLMGGWRPRRFVWRVGGRRYYLLCEVDVAVGADRAWFLWYGAQLTVES
jgi:hypothetical protein